MMLAYFNKDPPSHWLTSACWLVVDFLIWLVPPVLGIDLCDMYVIPAMDNYRSSAWFP